MENCVNTDSKKTVLRMMPYGIYILTADDASGNVAAATVNWVTQSAFAPPLVVVDVKADSGTYKTVKAAQAFALNMLSKEQKAWPSPSFGR
jgi:flavin reductase (DIM6/NTAB) family NADH-FMN oxidoreductase RutF